ncbi:MAG: DUF6624 domain-containing protein [Flavobacteriales bacterium]
MQILNRTLHSQTVDRMKWFSLIVFTSLPFGLWSQFDYSLATQLDSMKQEDQRWRNLAVAVQNGEVDSITLEQARHHMRRVDSFNHLLLVELFERHGFIGFDKAGTNGSHDFWLLMQHQDRYTEFQEEVLAAMETEVDKGNADAQNYAYLTDRVLVNSGRPQLFGTQMELNEEQTSFVPRTCEEPEKLNERRAGMGLPPIEDYVNMMNEHYHGSLKKD